MAWAWIGGGAGHGMSLPGAWLRMAMVWKQWFVELETLERPPFRYLNDDVSLNIIAGSRRGCNVSHIQTIAAIPIYTHMSQMSSNGF